MDVSQKCQYALRALFELAKCHKQGVGLTPASWIARKQDIPGRFLGMIMNELAHGGFIQSRRGVKGGFALAKEAREITVGMVVRYVDGPIGPVSCVRELRDDCGLAGNCAFIDFWRRVRDAVAGLYDGTTLQDLVDEEVGARSQQTVMMGI
ncbi:MAG: Rrf2 family transcriptional regulator [Planctomycetota bacterium]|nr:Rrf2 family transcriptional regulator [Planctomycetota bacterium]